MINTFDDTDKYFIRVLSMLLYLYWRSAGAPIGAHVDPTGSKTPSGIFYSYIIALLSDLSDTCDYWNYGFLSRLCVFVSCTEASVHPSC